MTQKRYLVRFLKTVTDDYGREHQAAQGEVEVAASSEALAVEQAKTEFCRLADLQDWWVHADRYEVCETEYAS